MVSRIITTSSIPNGQPVTRKPIRNDPGCTRSGQLDYHAKLKGDEHRYAKFPQESPPARPFTKFLPNSSVISPASVGLDAIELRDWMYARNFIATHPVGGTRSISVDCNCFYGNSKPPIRNS